MEEEDNRKFITVMSATAPRTVAASADSAVAVPASVGSVEALFASRHSTLFATDPVVVATNSTDPALTATESVSRCLAARRCKRIDNIVAANKYAHVVVGYETVGRPSSQHQRKS